jgi:GT2 family glycosyltransferase
MREELKIMSDVCALVVTFNRCEYLAKLLPALLGQTAKLTKIVIYDNHSNDGTQSILVELGLCDSPVPDEGKSVKELDGIEIHCLRSKYNAGGSGGFHDGIKYASELGCDYVWCMDDDVLPERDCLERLLVHMTPGRRICIPNRTTGAAFIDNAIIHVDMKNPLLYSIALRKTMIPANRVKDDVIPVEDMPFEGPLIDCTLIDEIGLPCRELFIIFDDSEYCARALHCTSVGFVKSAHLCKQIIPRADHSRLMGWKEYYGYRNQYWFDSTYGENAAVRVLRPFLSRCDLTLRAVIRRKWSNIRIISRAYHDGVRGILGKTVKPGGEV